MALNTYTSNDYLYLLEHERDSELQKNHGRLPIRNNITFGKALVGSEDMSEVAYGAQLLAELLPELEDDPRRFACMYYLAIADGRRKNYHSAIVYIRKILEEYPTDERTVCLFHEILAMLKQPKEGPGGTPKYLIDGIVVAVVVTAAVYGVVHWYRS